MTEHCELCGCQLFRTTKYADPTIEGRSGASEHHFIAKRLAKGVFASSPWKHDVKSAMLCYECHELLLHNPVLFQEDVKRFAELVRMRDLAEEVKPPDQSKIAGRVVLFHELIARGLQVLHDEETRRFKPTPTS
jgi:hypothetical protein